MSDPPRDIDCLIFGGGVAGLWTLARLMALGYSCLLIEKTALGSGQTIASQGIIHGGVKYALAGESSHAATSIAQMPRIWDDCLAGRGEVDLTAARVLSAEQFLWTTPGLVSRIAGFGASKVVRAEGERLAGSDRPEAFADAPRGVDVYRVPERVLDPRSVVEALAAPVNSAGCIRVLAQEPVVPTDEPSAVRFRGSPDRLVRFRAVVLAAGAGNETLMKTFGCTDAGLVQQLRPLHMVIARGAPTPIFGHCIGASNLPRLTITTSRDPATSELVWYIGGAIAEGDAIARTDSDQIAACKRELAECLPWLDLAPLKFDTFRVARAEGVRRIENPPQRPDEPTLARTNNIIVGWPTKLAFAPAFAARVIEHLSKIGVHPSGDTSPSSPDTQHSAPSTQHISSAPFPWEPATWT